MPRSKTSNTLQDDILAIKKQQEANRRDRRRLANAPIQQRRKLIALVVVLLLALVGLVFDTVQNQGGERLLKIVAKLPPAFVLRHNPVSRQASFAQMVAEVQEPVLNGDVIRTGEGGGVHLEFPDSTLIKIGPTSNFFVRYNTFSREDGSRRRRFYLGGGRVWCRVSKLVNADSEFSVETPTAVAAVQGTRFSIQVFQNTGNPNTPDGSTFISVQDGKVLVAARGVPQRTLVGPGQQTFVAPQMQSPPQPTMMSPQEQQVWKAQATGPLGSLGDVLAPPPSPVRENLTNLEEQFVGRPLSLAAGVAHMDSLSGEEEDRKDSEETGVAPASGLTTSGKAGQIADSLAQTAARSLQMAMENAYDPTTGYPETIGLNDLANVNIARDKVQQILGAINGGKLESYRRVGSKYIIYLRAKAPSNKLIEISPDEIKILGDVQLDGR